MNRFALILFAIMFLSTLVAAQSDEECKANPRTTPCRERAASTIQNDLASFPDIRVRAFGDVIVFSESKLFEKQEDRITSRNIIAKALDAQLCAFGFKKLRIESPKNATGEHGEGEDFDLRCSSAEGSASAAGSAARKQFAQESREATVKKMGSTLAPGFNITAEGPDATVFVYHQTQISYEQCNSMINNNQDWVSTLQKVGFTQLVCTDAGNARFPFDLRQEQPAPTQTQSQPTSVAGQPEPKPISEYMRRVGLLYLEQIDNFKRECGNVNLPLGDSCDSWVRVLESLDDRITVTLSKPERLAGDRPFFELLKRVEDAMHKVNIHAFLLAYDPNVDIENERKVFPIWIHIASTCSDLAHSEALSGIYTANEGECEINFDRQVAFELHQRQAQCESKGRNWQNGACYAQK